MFRPELIERRIQLVAQRLGVFDELEAFHALFVLDALPLQVGDQLGLCAIELGGKDRARVLEDRLDHRQNLQAVVVCVAVE